MKCRGTVLELLVIGYWLLVICCNVLPLKSLDIISAILMQTIPICLSNYHKLQVPFVGYLYQRR